MHGAINAWSVHMKMIILRYSRNLALDLGGNTEPALARIVERW